MTSTTIIRTCSNDFAEAWDCDPSMHGPSCEVICRGCEEWVVDLRDELECSMRPSYDPGTSCIRTDDGRHIFCSISCLEHEGSFRAMEDHHDLNWPY